jgi:hypothetical protein
MPELANRFVALNYDPNRPDAKPVRTTEGLQATRPVESDQEEFQPGLPIGTTAAAAPGTSAASRPAASTGATANASTNANGGKPAARPARFFHKPPQKR